MLKKKQKRHTHISRRRLLTHRLRSYEHFWGRTEKRLKFIDSFAKLCHAVMHTSKLYLANYEEQVIQVRHASCNKLHNEEQLELTEARSVIEETPNMRLTLYRTVTFKIIS